MAKGRSKMREREQVHDQEQESTQADRTEMPVEEVRLTRLTRQVMTVPIRGVSPLIVHAFSEKARREMDLGQAMKAAKKRKDLKALEELQSKVTQRASPEEQFERSLYRFPDGRYGFPVEGFKTAIVEAARFFPGLVMEDLKRMIWVLGESNGERELVPLRVGKPRMREDYTRASDMARTPLLTYRGEFSSWAADVRIRFLRLSPGSIVALVDAAGNNGIGDWRPSSPKAKNGQFGMWEVVANGEETKR